MNENVTGFEAILRILVDKFEHEPMLRNLGRFVGCFLTGGKGG